MRYVILIYDEGSANPPAEAPAPDVQQAMMDEYEAYTQLLKARGAFQAGEALQPVQTATTVRVRDGQALTTDGPFAETKEALGGFYLIDAKDLDEALELAGKCPGARFGSIEVRPVWELPADYAPEHAAAGSAS
jgi:hypothetical protein